MMSAKLQQNVLSSADSLPNYVSCFSVSPTEEGRVQLNHAGDIIEVQI